MHDRAADEPVSAAEAAALFGALSGFPVLVLAVSGGPDSTALMWLAARWRDGVEHPPKLIAVTVDHGLRKESAREALAVKQLARELKVEHRTLRWTGKKPETGIQATARKARYRLLSAAAQRAGARHILTAHTLDDQAETILFRLARGSGISGLRGMAPLAPLPACGERSARAAGRRTLGRSARLDSPPYPDLRPACQEREPAIVRPLLRIPKSRLLATLAVAKIPFSDDPSNRDPRFTRPRLRELMPALAAEGLDAARLAALGRRMARADQAIERAADDAMKAHARGIAKSVVFGPGHADLPPEVALRLLHRAIEQVGNEGPVELGKLEALYQALDAARGSPGRFRRTLAGAMITLSGSKLTVEPTPSRRIGAKTRASGPKAAFTKPR